MRILVTGGRGTIGRPVVKALEEVGHDVWVCDLGHDLARNYLRCDVAEYRQIERVMELAKPELVYHLAAEFGRRNGEDFYEALWQTNAIGTKNILRLQERHRFRMVFASSSEIYGEYSGLMSESVPDRLPIQPLNDYAISKWANELQVRNSSMRSGTETVRVRIFNTYGPGEYYSPYRSVACIFVYHAMHGMPYDVYLNHRRSSTYIDDTIAALRAIADHFKTGEVYNICGDECHSIRRLSDLVLKETGAPRRLARYRKVEAFNTLVKRGDNRKAKRELHWTPRVSLEDGVRRTVEWQRNVYLGGKEAWGARRL